MKVTIYSKPNCPFCTKAKALAEMNKDVSEVVYLMLGEDFDAKEFMEKFPQARTFPQIVVSATKIGGYVQFEEFLNNAEAIRKIVNVGE